jgi:serine/threonine protein kinase
LGIILYLLTTGTHPFNGRTASATLYKISCPEQVKPPSELVPDYPSELEATVLRCLEKDPARRFATSDELVWALESSLAPELRATDQDVAVLVRSLAGDLGARRLRALRSAGVDVNAVSDPKGPDRYRTPHLSRGSETKSYERGARKPTPSRERNAYRPLLLCAALVGSVGALTLESVFRGVADGSANSASPPVVASPRGHEVQPRVAKLELLGRRSSKPTPARSFGRSTANGLRGQTKSATLPAEKQP